MRWIAGVRLAAVPFALLDAAVEDWPAGDAAWAWANAGVLAAGAVALRRRALPGLALDLAIVSSYVVLYAFDPGTPVRLLLVLVVLEAALLYGARGGAAAALAAAPALALFEWRGDFGPYDAVHVAGPVGILILVGLAAGARAGGAGTSAAGGGGRARRSRPSGRA